MRKKKEIEFEPDKALALIVKEPPTIGELALKFVTSPEVNPFQRAIIVAKLKKLIDKILELDGYMQEEALSDYFHQNSNGNNCPIPDEPFIIVRRQVKRTKYSDDVKAQAIMKEIDKLKYQLKKLEVVDSISETFYLKYKEESNGNEKADKD